MELTKKEINKIIETARYYYKDKDLSIHAQQAYEFALNKERLIKDNQAKQLELLALCMVSTYKAKIYPSAIFPALARLTGLRTEQFNAVLGRFGELDKYLEILEDGDSIQDVNAPDREVDIFEDLRNEEEKELAQEEKELEESQKNAPNPPVDPDGVEIEGCYSSNKEIIDEKLIHDIYMSSDVDNMANGEQLEFDDANVGIVAEDYSEKDNSMASYFQRRLDSIKTIELESEVNTLDAQKKIASGRIKVYAALEKRSQERSWLSAIFHPFNTYKEWKMKNNLGNELKEKYHLTDNTLGKLCNMCDDPSDDFKYIDSDGQEVNKEPVIEPKVEKETTKYDVMIDEFKESVLNCVNELDYDELSKNTQLDKTNNKSNPVNQNDNKEIKIDIND